MKKVLAFVATIAVVFVFTAKFAHATPTYATCNLAATPNSGVSYNLNTCKCIMNNAKSGAANFGVSISTSAMITDFHNGTANSDCSFSGSDAASCKSGVAYFNSKNCPATASSYS